jgi:curved DNA-binding protein
MDFKDYYQTLGLAKTASADEIKRAYRKLARKYHPDVSKEPDAEARFKEVAEAHEALCDTERRAAYDDIASRHARGETFAPPPGWDSGFEFSGGPQDGGNGFDDVDHSDFFASLFGRQAGGRRGASGFGQRANPNRAGGDHHARIRIDLIDAYRGGARSLSLRGQQAAADGRLVMRDRQLDVNIPPGVRNGQQLRLAGQGGAGQGDGPAGDLYLEIEIAPHPLFRVDGRDVYLDLPVAPWEAALGASVTVPLPDGSVELTVPAGSTPGRRLRLKGKGLPSVPPGDLYAVLTLALPSGDGAPAQAAWRALAASFPAFNPRQALEGARP